MITVTAKSPILLPAKQINLPKWFYSFTEGEFQQSSKSNLAMNIENDPNGKHVFNNNVAISGHLLENYYLKDASNPNHLKMTSANSRLFLFGQIPISIKVSYELSIVATSPTSAELVCISSAQYPKWLEIISKLTLAKSALQKHQDEETAFFAKDIFKKQSKKTF